MKYITESYADELGRVHIPKEIRPLLMDTDSEILSVQIKGHTICLQLLPNQDGEAACAKYMSEIGLLQFPVPIKKKLNLRFRDRADIYVDGKMVYLKLG